MKLPAGLLDANIEFFADTNSLKAFALQSGQVVAFEDFPQTLKTSLWHQAMRFPEKLRLIRELVGSNPDDQLKQFLFCTFGGFDHQPDMVQGKLQEAEYWPCPKRGNCKYEGRLCSALITATGEVLSKREVEILTLIALGTLERDIAIKLFIARTTVAVHVRNISHKTGLHTKADHTRFAILKNLI